MHFAQRLLKRQFPYLNGLQLTVLQAKKSLGVRKPLPNQLQVIHSHGDHWILASNIGCSNGDVNVYGFQSSAIKIVESQKQEGGIDCGVFAIATATALAHGIRPSSFNQSAMRRHLVNCFTEGLITPFPCF